MLGEEESSDHMEQRRVERGGVYPSLREYYNNMGRGRRLSPRVKMGLQIYASGAAKTVKEAAEIVGLSQVHLGNVKNLGGGQELIDRMQGKIEDAAVNTSALLRSLGVEAVHKLAALMRTAGSENIQLAAAKDLADRSPETSKTQKIQVDSFSINGEDAKHLAEAMIRAQQSREVWSGQTQGDFVKVDMGQQRPVLLPDGK